jgi:hypothetical protein
MTITELINKLEKAKEDFGDLPIRKGIKRKYMIYHYGDVVLYHKDSDIHSVGQPEKWLELYL